MKHPVHPGRMVKTMYLEPLNLTITETAGVLDVTRPTLSKVINGKASLSPEMAIRLAKAFGSTAETWLQMQVAYDLAQIKYLAHTITVKRYPPYKAAQALANHLKTLPMLDNRSPDALLSYDAQGLPIKD